MRAKISPSMMCADIYEIQNILKTFNERDIEYLHIDVMDGFFVPNFMLSEGVVNQYRKRTDIPFDYHLMVENPLEKIDWFNLKKGDLMSIHIESTTHLKECLLKIREKSARPGIAIKPLTPVSEISPYLNDIDFILVMTVNPGFAGQKLVPETLNKIKEVRDYLDAHHKKKIFIEVDGNVSFENAKKMREKGADVFVAGTSSIFQKDLSLDEGITRLREAIEQDIKKVFVIGSINMDLVMSLDRLPTLGESKLGHNFFQNQGGKGANQAIAARKLGVRDVYLIGAVGDDSNGEVLINDIKKYKVNTEGILINKDVNTGVCIILFDEGRKDNVLAVDKGANMSLDPLHVRNFLKKYASKGDILISQLEVNLDSVFEGFKVAKEIGMYTILNPAPICDFDKSLLEKVDLLIPNETEVELLTNIKPDCLSNFLKIYETLHVKDLIVTLGSKGGYYICNKEIYKSPIYPVEVVDTTCAGDTYIGALAYKLSKDISLKDSLNFASKASSITVSRKGAGISIPYLKEISEEEE